MSIYFEQIATLAVIGLMIYLIIRNKYETAVIFLIGNLMFLLLGIIDIEDIISSSSNRGLFTILFLFILAGKVQRSKYIYSLADKIFDRNFGTKKSIFRMMAPIGFFSAFANNIPLVSILSPIARKWGIENEISPSKLLIPISYASIFGGMLTLVGTSTNLIVSGLLENRGYQPLGMFEMTKVTVILFFIGLCYMIFIGIKLLPDNKDILELTKKRHRDYLITMKVDKSCSLVGKTITNAGLRNLDGLYLFEIIRQDGNIHPIDPDTTTIEAYDSLIFTGQVETILQLQDIEGFNIESSSDDYLENLKSDSIELVEAVVSEEFPFLDKTIRESKFRSRYNSAVIAVLRKGKRINEKIGDIKLKQGDTLLLMTSEEFLNNWGDSKDFYIISERIKQSINHNNGSNLSLFLFCAIILLSALGVVPLLEGSFISIAILFILKKISTDELSRYINWSTILTIVLSLSIGTAVYNSGLASLIADIILEVSAGYGIMVILAMIFIFTNIFTEIISNSSAAIIMFPIGLELAISYGIDPRIMAMTIAIAATASFASPIGYQTNLMIYGIGGYKFSDFIKVGLPLNVLFMFFTVLLMVYWV